LRRDIEKMIFRDHSFLYKISKNGCKCITVQYVFQFLVALR